MFGGWRMGLWILLVVVSLYFLYLVRNVVIPFALSLLVSAMLEPLCRKVANRGVKWRRAVGLVWSFLFVAVIGLLIYLTPQISRQVVTLRDKVEGVSTRVAEQTAQDNFFMRWNPQHIVATDPTYRQIDQLFADNQENLKRVGLPTTRRMAVSQYVEPYRQQFTRALTGFFQSVVGVVGSIGANAMLWGFVPFLVLLILLDLERFKTRAQTLVPPSIRADTVDLISDIFNVFVRYLRGMGLMVVWYVVISAVTLSITGAPYAFLLAPLFAMVYLIPMIGGFLNLILLFILTGLSGKTGNLFLNFPTSWAFAGFVVICYLVVFTIFDNLIYTKIVGGSVGLHPLVSFFVVFSAGALLGPVGMVLAFPVAGAMKIILDRLLEITSKPQDLHLPARPLRHRSV